jgi:hypothetical protein
MTQDEFALHKILTIAHIAGRLIYASYQMNEHGEGINFTIPPDRAAELAEDIFNAAEARVLGNAPTAPQRSTPERLRLIRLNEKLRQGTIDSTERLELVEIIEGGV